MQESGGWAGAESSAGAIGLMQIMPSYHSCASWKPVRNIACGVNILTPLVLKYDLRGGLAAYNAGETGMSRGLGYDYADAVVAIFDKVGLSSELAMK
jgi:soluble lytic murein transglycosylase-like protein